jgi:flagellar biosynthesis protein FliQ
VCRAGKRNLVTICNACAGYAYGAVVLKAGEAKVTSEFALQLFSEMLRTGTLVCAPLLGVTLVTGLLVSIVQVVTQIQDATLAFVPKLLVFVVTTLVLAPWMLRKLMAFAQASLAQAMTLH